LEKSKSCISQKIRSTAMAMYLILLVSVAGTTGMNMSIENNMLRLLKQFQWGLSNGLSIFPSSR